MVFCGDWDLDKCIMIDYIKDLPFIRSSTRERKVGKMKQDGSVYSSLYGTSFKNGLNNKKEKDPTGGFYSKLKTSHPELGEIFEEFRDLYFPYFEYKNIQINKNYHCNPHFDACNSGESILVCLGEYTGGLTCYYDEDEPKKYNRIKKIDARIEPLLLDGSKHLHWTEPFKGQRYSLVYFSGKGKYN